MHCYPSFMVPYIGLNPKVSVDALLVYSDFAIARRIDQPYSDTDFQKMADGLYYVKNESSLHDEFFERIPKLSVTMLRCEYPIETAKYKLKMKPRKDDWKGNIVVWPWKHWFQAIMMNESYLIVYKASRLQNQPIKYQRKFNNKKEAEELKEYYEELDDALITNKFTKETRYTGIGKIFLEHSPTMLNYWHYELKLEDSEGKEIDKVKIPASGEINKKQDFVEYVWKNFLSKRLRIDKNPCCEDIPYKCFYDNMYGSRKRQGKRIINKCLFSIFPIAK